MTFLHQRICVVVAQLGKVSLFALSRPSVLSISSLSTLGKPTSLDDARIEGSLSEYKVLRELSELLPISPKTLVPNPCIPEVPKSQLQIDGAIDNILPPENKLRGVFVQKLVGNATLVPNPCIPEVSKNQLQIGGAIDYILPPEDKLRGVFVQKLIGSAAINNALDCASANLDVTVELVEKVVDRGNLSGEAMVLFFNWAIKQSSVSAELSTYHVILRALGRRKFFQMMFEVLLDMHAQGISPTCETLMILMDSLVRARQISKAIEMFSKLEGYGLRCDNNSFKVLLQCLCQRSHVGTAKSLLNSMKEKFEFDTMTFNVIIGGWARLGQVSEIEKVLKEMIDNGFEPDAVTYSYLITGFGQAGMVDDALRIFNGMEHEGHLPDTSVVNALISVYISARDFGACLKCYEKMLQEPNCPPNLDTYNKLIGALLKSRKVADALDLFNEMLKRGFIPTTGTVTGFIEALCSYGPPHAAMLIYDGARKAGCNISLTAYKLLLKRLSSFGKCGMLVKLWHEMQDIGYASDMEVYECIIDGLCNNGQLDSAVLAMEESLGKDFCPSRLIWSKLNKKLIASNKVREAYKLFLKIKVAREKENARRYWCANGWHF